MRGGADGVPKREVGSSPKRNRKGSAAEHAGPRRPIRAPASHERRRPTAILDAAEELFSRRDPNRVTIREIAEKAGVTHPLVHQYVGSKQDILDAVIRRGAPQRHQIMAEHPDLRDAIPLLIADIVGRRVHSRAILRSAMDGVTTHRLRIGWTPDECCSDWRMRRFERERPRPQPPGAMDPRIVMAAMTALAYGWVGAQDWLMQIFQLEEVDPTDCRARSRTSACTSPTWCSPRRMILSPTRASDRAR